jgi:nucleotide-binding universal stress UspA family protein
MAIKPIVVGTDGSEQSLRAVAWAANEALLHDAPLRIVTVPAIPSHPGSGSTLELVTNTMTQAAEKALRDAAERANLIVPGLKADTVLIAGKPARVLTDAAAAASMLVVGARRTGSFTALGSVSRQLAAHPPCPLVVERAATPQPTGQIVVGVHDSDDSAAALAFAFAEAARRGAQLLVVHAWFWLPPAIATAEAAQPVVDPHQVSTAALARLSELLAPWRKKHPEVEVGEQVVHALAGRALARASASADLVVMGSHDGRTHESPGGSVIHTVLNHAQCPVSIVPVGQQG